MPSILRNSSRFRRDARQPPEEEEMWFNEDDEFEDVPTDTKITPDLDSSISKVIYSMRNTFCSYKNFDIGKIMFEKKAETVNSPKSILPQSNQVQTQHQQQQFTSQHLSVSAAQTIVNSINNNVNNSKSSSETMTSSEEDKYDDDQTPKIEGNEESDELPKGDNDNVLLDEEADNNSLDSSSSEPEQPSLQNSSSSDTVNVDTSNSEHTESDVVDPALDNAEAIESINNSDESSKKVSLI